MGRKEVEQEIEDDWAFGLRQKRKSEFCGERCTLVLDTLLQVL